MKHAAMICGMIAATSAVAHAQQSDLLVEQSAPEQAVADSDVTFSVTLTNFGPDASASVTLDDPLPAGMTFVSANADVSWVCTTPSVGATGSISCTNTQLDVAQPASFTFVGHIDAATPPGTYFANVVTSSTATDPNSENDSATATVQTPPPPTADVGVTVQGPSATNPDHDVVYTIDLVTGGPDAAGNVSLTTTLPGDMTFVSLTQDSGPAFACSSGVAITCTLASLEADKSASFTLIGHVPPATADGTHYQLFANVSSNYDPNTENDQSPTLLCVQQDSCAAGACNNNQAVVCPGAQDQCHDAFTCDTVSAECEPNAKPDDTACDDSDACTQTDTCQAGVCTGANPVVCTVAGQCENQGTCESATGVCAANTKMTDGTACDDGDACTQTDSCDNGACAGADPVTCTLAGQCQVQGTCNPASGTCAKSTAKANGSACDDGDACTVADSCRSGACKGKIAAACVDAGASDAGGADASVTPDAGQGVAGNSGGTQSDASTADAGGGAVADAGGAPDAAHTASEDAGNSDDAGGAGIPTSAGGGGCNCRVAAPARPRSAGASLLFVLFAAAALARRSRRARWRQNFPG